MSELSPQARAALNALGSPEPTAADERRVRDGVERAVGVLLPAAAVVGAVTVGSTAAAATGASSAAMSASSASAGASLASFTALGTGAKVMLFVAAVGVGSVVTAGTKAVVSPKAATPAVQSSAEKKSGVRAIKSAEDSAGAIKSAEDSAGAIKSAEDSAGAIVAEPVVAVEPVVVEEQPVDQPVDQPAVVAEVSAPRPLAPKERERVRKVVTPEVTSDPVVAIKSAEGSAGVVAPTPSKLSDTPDLVAPPPAPAAAPTPETATTEAGFELVVEAYFPSCNRADELRTALAARRLLNEQRAEHALFLIGAYQKHCPSGQWSDEAWRVRLSSLCALGRDTEAASLFEWFATEYPARRFAIESELRSTCEPSVLGKE